MLGDRQVETKDRAVTHAPLPCDHLKCLSTQPTKGSSIVLWKLLPEQRKETGRMEENIRPAREQGWLIVREVW
jgi:hypothetical protein